MINNSKQVIIKYRNTKLFVILILSIIAFIVALKYFETLFFGTRSLKAQLLVLIGYLIFVGFLLWLTWFLFKNKDFIIDSKGFQVKSNLVLSQTVFWEEVTGFEIQKDLFNKVIIVKLKDPQKYLQDKDNFTASFLQYNYKHFGSPIIISSNIYGYEAEKLMIVLEEYLLAFNLQDD